MHTDLGLMNLYVRVPGYQRAHGREMAFLRGVVQWRPVILSR